MKNHKASRLGMVMEDLERLAIIGYAATLIAVPVATVVSLNNQYNSLPQYKQQAQKTNYHQETVNNH